MVVPDGIALHDAPSKCRIVPASPTAHPSVGLRITKLFRLLEVGGDA
jgi:hypothetical protein